MNTILFSAALVLAGSAFAQKPFLHAELSIFQAGLIENVPSASYTIRRWDNDGWSCTVSQIQISANKSIELPEPCVFEAGLPLSDSNSEPHCQINDVDVWDATYADCPEAFTFCRCRSSPISEEQLVVEFGRLPIGLRQEVGVLMAMPDEGVDAGWAYARGNT